MPTPPARPGRRRNGRLLTAATAGLVAAAALSVAAVPSAQAAPEQSPAAARGGDDGKHGGPDDRDEHGPTTDLQVLAVNDFHGALEPPSGSGGRVTHEHHDGSTQEIDAGGVEYLATALRQARRGESRSVTVAAGDMVGASPMLSGLFRDEPAIEALNKLKMDVVGVGNHEFDLGAEELLRKQNGGCHPVDGCYDESRTFEGADFPFLAANVVDEDTREPLLDPYTIKKIKDVEVGFIGVTLQGTKDVVTPAGIEGLEFLDEAETLDKYTAQLKRKGVNAVVALIHEGGYPSSPAYNHACESGSDGLSGPVVDIAERTDAGVDALVTGHTHEAYVCSIPDPEGNERLVTSAASNGRLFTELNMSYDRRTKDIVRTSVEGTNQVVHREHPKARDLSRLLGFWNTLAGPVAQQPIGWISEDITADRNIPESPLGDLIADAQLAHGRSLDESVELAMMNPGGIRTDLTYAASGSEGDGVVTYEEGYSVQPFSNTVNLADLTGAQLLEILRQQVSGVNEETPRVLQVSEGFTYILDRTRSGADRVVADSVRLNGESLEADRTYRVAMNSFLASGGDGFTTFAEGTDPYVGGVDRDALEEYLTSTTSADDPLSAPAADRITVLG